MEGYFGDAVSSQCSECTCDVLGTDPEKYGFDGVYEKMHVLSFQLPLRQRDREMQLSAQCYWRLLL